MYIKWIYRRFSAIYSYVVVWSAVIGQDSSDLGDNTPNYHTTDNHDSPLSHYTLTHVQNRTVLGLQWW